LEQVLNDISRGNSLLQQAAEAWGESGVQSLPGGAVPACRTGAEGIQRRSRVGG